MGACAGNNIPRIFRGTVNGKAKYARILIRKREPMARDIHDTETEKFQEALKIMKESASFVRDFCKQYDCDDCPIHQANYRPGKGFGCTLLPMHWEIS